MSKSCVWEAEKGACLSGVKLGSNDGLLFLAVDEDDTFDHLAK